MNARRHHHNRLGFAGALLCLAVMLTSCADRRAVAADSTGESLRVARGPFVRTMLLTGELVAEDGVSLITPNANIWPMQVRWLAEDGIEVRAGDPVVEFDNSQLASNLDELRATVIEARNQLTGTRARVANEVAEAAFALEEARAQLEKSQLEAEVPVDLFAAREYEQRQLDWRKARLDLAEAEQKLESARGSGQADIEIQKVTLASAEHEADRAESRVALFSLAAPRDGIFLRTNDRREGRPYDIGDNVWPGLIVASIPDLGTMMVEAKLYDVDDGRIAPGMPVRAILDAHPDQVFHGSVRSIDQLAREDGRRSSRRTFRTLVTLDKIDLDRMRPGMSVRLEIDAISDDDVLTAPRVALDWSAAGARAFRRGGAVAVRLGPCNAERCVVVSGLEEGEVLVSAPAVAG